MADEDESGGATGVPGGNRTVGRYEVLREIGRGGMGLVFEVERDDGVVRQRAALKLIRRGMDSGDFRRCDTFSANDL